MASGGGSDAEAILHYFENHNAVEVTAVASNKPGAGVLQRAEKFGVDSFVFSKVELQNGSLLESLKKLNIDLIVLAGFLQLVPESFVKAFPNRILNIHPSLLPAFGGKGMYGMNVHKAVKEAKSKSSGMSVHVVNEKFDEGALLFQASVVLSPSDSPDDIAAKVLKLEHQHYPFVIEQFLKNQL